MRTIIVGSRESPLAVVQSRLVAEQIERTGGTVKAELRTMKTTGDRILDRSLDEVGGKGLFVKELDLALREKRTDLSVHSLKDVPMDVDPSLPLVAFSRREDPRDVLVLPQAVQEEWRRMKTGNPDAECPLPDSSLPIGSSSLRRTLQLKKLYPDHAFEPVRGNLQTRLRKLDEGEYGALVLAAAGMKRMGLEDRISRYFTIEEMIPAAGQGILAVQGRAGEDHSYLDGFADPDGTAAALCERAYVRELNGGCTSPVCAHAQIENGRIFLTALYWDENTGEIRTGTAEGSTDDAETIGKELARKLRG